MTAAWIHYLTSNQFLLELRGLTSNYPISGDLVQEAYARVTTDPESNRSWNLAWLCLMKMKSDALVGFFAAAEAARPDMWGDNEPSASELEQLTACFEYEWNAAIDTMLRHWTSSPTWY